MGNLIDVAVVDGIGDLSENVSGVLFGKITLILESVEKLTTVAKTIIVNNLR